MRYPSDSPARPVRVLVFQTHADNSGTMEISRLLHAGLSARGYAVQELFLVRGTEHLHDGTHVVVDTILPEHGLWGYAWMPFRTWKQLRRLKPDVVLAMQWGGIMLSSLAAPFAFSPAIISNQFSVPVVPRIVRWIDKVQGVLGAFARVVVNSRDVEDCYAHYPERYRKRIVHIPHGFREKTSTHSKAQARALLGLPQDVTLLGSVGRLSWEKNLETAIKLLPGNPGWHLALCGHGGEETALVALAETLGCADRLHILGEILPDKVGTFLRSLDVFVFPSRAETFGLAVVEAAQAGLPVVANQLAVLREVLAVDGEPCALFVDASDSAAFAAAVGRLLSDDALRRELTARGRRLSERYPLDAMYDAYDQLIKTVLAERRSA